MPVAAPADKRFRRSHVHPGKKRNWLPSWRTAAIVVVVVAVVLYGAVRVAGFVLGADALAVRSIAVTGTNRMPEGDVLAILDGLRGTSMVTADLEGWRQKLLDAPWVADASIRRVFPGTVAVEIAERQPLGIGQIRSALYLIDEAGIVIDEFGPKYAAFDLPIIIGLSPAAGDPDPSAAERRAALAGQVLADFQRHQDLARRVSQVDVSNVNDAVVILNDDTALLHTGDGHFAERVQLYLDLSARLHADVPLIDSVDLRFGDNVFVKPQGVARTPVASAVRRKE